ncbi:exopolysaccharide biosynthesis protein [Brevundimonas sp. M20]|uniref:exopolysaccharide biosynthesis protein n=1 Tax=Brevundimonas sp. M20 TaxID=2591463 RepID=UPI0011464BEA|nr:exopolysaccharide biosynthesis protein [Brevundimonas sp. M20]QDH73956.1 exopolysaccharide biosynthesis protein [Brevundimonas sp. M20]
MPDYDYQADTRPFSQVIEDIGAKNDPKLYIGELINAFGERGFGATLLFFGLLNMVFGAVPGTTTVLGAPMLLIGVQLVTRRDQLWMPRWLLARSIERATYREAVAKVLSPLRKVERLARPRLEVMTNELSEILIGVAIVLIAAVLMLPIPGGNFVPSFIMSMFGFGLLQRDGLAVLVGWAAVALVAMGGVVVWLAWEWVAPYLLPVWHWLLSWPAELWHAVTGLFS